MQEIKCQSCVIWIKNIIAGFACSSNASWVFWNIWNKPFSLQTTTQSTWTIPARVDLMLCYLPGYFTMDIVGKIIIFNFVTDEYKHINLPNVLKRLILKGFCFVLFCKSGIYQKVQIFKSVPSLFFMDKGKNHIYEVTRHIKYFSGYFNYVDE